MLSVDDLLRAMEMRAACGLDPVGGSLRSHEYRQAIGAERPRPPMRTARRARATPRAVALPTGDQLAEWDGLCMELVNELLNAHPDGEILWVDLPPSHPRWKYHAVIVLDGLVYDAWHPDARLPPAEYVAAVFGDEATWELNRGASE